MPDKNLKIMYDICLALYKGIGQANVLEKHKENKEFHRFLDKLYTHYGEGVIGEEFLWNFLTYNMTCLFGRKTSFGSMVMLNWLLSQKSIERWNMRDSEKASYFCSEFLRKYGIKREISFEKVDLEDLEELERGRFLNTEIGFLNCQSFATYNQYSPSCQRCRFKKQCRK